MKFFINSYFGDNHSIGLLSHIKKRLPLRDGMINGWCSAIIRKEVGLSITCGISSLIFMVGSMLRLPFELFGVICRFRL